MEYKFPFQKKSVKEKSTLYSVINVKGNKYEYRSEF